VKATGGIVESGLDVKSTLPEDVLPEDMQRIAGLARGEAVEVNMKNDDQGLL
jgi:hypothetical protein